MFEEATELFVLYVDHSFIFLIFFFFLGNMDRDLPDI